MSRAQYCGITRTGEGSLQLETELTGNDYVCIPFIGADCGLDGVNVLHGGSAGLLEWAGPSEAQPLFRVRLSLNGQAADLSQARWRRLDRWIPTFSMSLPDGTVITGMVCAPGGYPGARGFLLRLEAENRGRTTIDAAISLEVRWQYSRLRIATARPHGDRNQLRHDAEHGALLLAMDAGRGATLAVLGSQRFESAETTQRDAANGDALEGTVTQKLNITSQRKGVATFFVGAGREPDGAVQSALSLRRTGADALIRQARLELSHTLRSAQDHRWAEALNRNLVFNRYFACGRAIDDDRLYMLRSRSPYCAAPAIANERESLFWTLPALIIADPGVAREALLRHLELFSERSGEHRRYIDGATFDAAFALDQLVLYAWALLRYVRDTGDEHVMNEPLVQQVLNEIDVAAFMRLHPQHMLAATDVLPSGDAADYAYASISNVLLWWFSQNLTALMKREPGDQPPNFEGAAAEIAAALWQHCIADVNGRSILASSADLEGNAAVYDDPAFSLSLLPFFGFCTADDPVWRDTVEFLRSREYPLWRDGKAAGIAERARPQHARLSALCADLLAGMPGAIDRLQQLRLPGGIAAAAYDSTTAEMSEPHHAALAGFLAWTLVTVAEPARETTTRKKRRR
jgi:uncharacterized protein